MSSTSRASASPPAPPFAKTSQSATRAPAFSAASRTIASSASVSVPKRLIATTSSIPNCRTFWMWCSRFTTALPERGEVLGGEFGLLRAAVHLERADGGDEHRGLGLDAPESALDVEELLGAQVGPEAGLGHDDVADGERGAGGEDRVAAVRDVAERPGVHEGGPALERLHQVGRMASLSSIAMAPCALRSRARTGLRRRRVEPTMMLPRRARGRTRSRRERDDRHDLRRGDDHEALLADHSLAGAAEADDHLPQRAVVHVDRARPGDAARIDVERVALLEVVVEHRAQERCAPTRWRGSRP
jgi:hypothetical protein